MRFLGIFLATLFTGLFISLFVSSSANAQSAYDNTISTVRNIYLTTPANAEEAIFIDVSFTLGQVIQQNCSTNQYNFFRDVTSDYANGARWAITQQYESGTNIGATSVLFITNKIDDSIPNSSNYDTNAIAKFNQAELDEPQLHVDSSEQISSLSIGIDSVTGDIVCRYSDDRAIASYLAWDSPPMYHKRPFLNLFEIDYPENYQGGTIPDIVTPPTTTPVWLNYSVKFVDGEKMIIQSENWTNYRDKHGGGIRYGDVGGTSDITVCRIEDKDNTGCIDTVAFTDNQSGPIHLEYPKTMVGEVGYYKVFIDNSNKTPKIPPFDEDDYPFDVKNRSIIIFNDGTSTTAIDTIGYYDNEPYFPQYDDNVYYNKFMNHNLIDDHGLMHVILAPIGYLSELPKVNCQPLHLPMPARFGEDINLPCMTESVYESQFPEIFRIYQLLITAIFSYMVGLRLFQNIKEMSSEKDDRIEVVNL